MGTGATRDGMTWRAWLWCWVWDVLGYLRAPWSWRLWAIGRAGAAVDYGEVAP